MICGILTLIIVGCKQNVCLPLGQGQSEIVCWPALVVSFLTRWTSIDSENEGLSLERLGTSLVVAGIFQNGFYNQISNGHTIFIH